MEALLRPIFQEKTNEQNTLGVVTIEKKENKVPITDHFDCIILVIVQSEKQPLQIDHYYIADKKIALYVVEKQLIEEWILMGTNRKIIDWLLNGQIIFDRNDIVETIQQKLVEFPYESRKIKVGIEFAKLIRRYMDGKGFLNNHQYLDAYNHVVHALHHLARVVVINHGIHPEVTVWKQVKQIDPEIYKLYEELVESDESLNKRLQLLFLASEFLIHNHLEEGTEFLFEVMSSKDRAWSFSELMDHPVLKTYSIDLNVLIEYLVEKHYLSIEKEKTSERNIYTCTYEVKK